MNLESGSFSPPRIAKNIQTEIMPFIDFVIKHKKQFCNSKLKETYLAYKSKLKKMEKNEQEFLLNGIASDEWEDKSMYKEGVKFVVSYMFVYLGLIETVAKCAVDMLVLLLVANGRKFEVERHGKKIVIEDWKSIDKHRVSLFEELDFLNRNGIPSLMNLLDSRLRNDIAHVKFRIAEEPIDDEWILFIQHDKNGHKVEVLASEVIPQCIRNLLDSVDIVKDVLRRLDCLI